jgi:mycothiol synthase
MYVTGPAGPQDLRKMLRLALAGQGQAAAEVEDLVSGFIEYARIMRFDLTRHWWCRRGEQIVGACMCIESPGRTAMLLLPCTEVLGSDREIMAVLLDRVLGEARDRGTRLVQCLVLPGDERLAAQLESLAFTFVAELIYLERDIEGSGPPAGRESTPGEAMEWRTYDPQNHELFAETILLTYEGSLDCRNISGLRDIEDIIAGHKGAGIFDPRHWRILLINGVAAGCILLAESPLQPHLEVAYMGVCPGFRGRGLGHLLVSEALRHAYRERCQKVTLAVDASNGPALDIYKRLYFMETARRTAWVHRIAPTPSGSMT